MSSLTNFPSAFSYQLGSFTASAQPAFSSDAEHTATTTLMSGLLQSVYDLASELRGMGPVAHQLLHEVGEPTLRERLQQAITVIGELQDSLRAAHDSHAYAQITKLGITDESRDLQLHIGCGGHHLPGWINLDNYPAPLAVNLDNGLPLPNNSSQYVFLSHLLEHLFYPTQSHQLLAEIHRVLQPGGVVRIVVPDIEQCINAYIIEDQAFFEDRRKHWTWLPKDMTRLESFLAYAGAGPNPETLFESHKFGYDFETLRRCLLRAGFTNIRRCRFQDSPHEALRVDHASSNADAQHGGGHYSLFVEAEKAES